MQTIFIGNYLLLRKSWYSKYISSWRYVKKFLELSVKSGSIIISNCQFLNTQITVIVPNCNSKDDVEILRETWIEFKELLTNFFVAVYHKLVYPRLMSNFESLKRKKSEK